MRTERRISIAAVVVMLCCMGAVAGVHPTATSKTHMTSVIVQARACDLNVQVAKKLDAPERTPSCIFDVDMPEQINIEEWHNLPPPICG